MPKISSDTPKVEARYTESAIQAVHALRSLQGSDFLKILDDPGVFALSQEHGESLSRFPRLGILGIGGSSLGPKVIADFFGASERLLVFENVDPVSFERRITRLDLSEIHWLVISKSGKTLETLSQLSVLLPLYRDKGLTLKDHFTVISDPTQNPLVLWAKTESVITLPIPLNLGGRFSVLSPVGMVPAAFLGLQTSAFRKGAVEAREDSDLIASLVAQTLASFDRSEWITAFWMYSDLLGSFGGWIQQLWAESLAKSKTRSGGFAPRVSTPLPLIGANDQHSILQQLMEGSRDKFIWFLGLDEVEDHPLAIAEPVGLPDFLKGQRMGEILRSERLATQKALSTVGVSTLSLQAQSVSGCSLGRLFMTFQCVVAATAEALDLNAFDQPGVELGKGLAYDRLKMTERKQG